MKRTLIIFLLLGAATAASAQVRMVCDKLYITYKTRQLLKAYDETHIVTFTEDGQYIRWVTDVDTTVLKIINKEKKDWGMLITVENKDHKEYPMNFIMSDPPVPKYILIPVGEKYKDLNRVFRIASITKTKSVK